MSDGNQQIIEEFRADGGRLGGVPQGTPVVLVHVVYPVLRLTPAA